MDDFLKNKHGEDIENKSNEGFPEWLKIIGVIVGVLILGFIISEFGFVFLLIIWAIVWVFGLLIGKG